MDSFELNKIAGAVLGSVLLLLVLGIFAETIYHEDTPDQPGYVVEIADAPETEDADEDEVVESVLPLLAAADINAGQKVAKKCASCHAFESGGKNKVGPPMWDIVNRVAGTAEGFGYSDAMVAFGTNGEVWGYDQLDGFLTKPKDYLPGTSMGFAGVKKLQDRANLIGYLRSLADSPADLPAAEPAAAEPENETATETESPATDDPAAEAQQQEPAEAEMPAETTEAPGTDEAEMVEPATETVPVPDTDAPASTAETEPETPAAGTVESEATDPEAPAPAPTESDPQPSTDSTAQ